MPIRGAVVGAGAGQPPLLYPDSNATRSPTSTSAGHRRAVTVDAVDTADKVSRRPLLLPSAQLPPAV